MQKCALIVEDQVILREALLFGSELLFGEGCKVEAYGNLDFLSVTIKPLIFDYAVIDPGLPGISANDVRGRLLSVKTIFDCLSEKCVKIVFTGNYCSIERDQMIDLGADRYLNKLAVEFIDLGAEIKSARAERLT